MSPKAEGGIGLAVSDALDSLPQWYSTESMERAFESHKSVHRARIHLRGLNKVDASYNFVSDVDVGFI